MSLLAIPNATVWLSDVHLTESRPDITATFLAVLKAIALSPDAYTPQALYILGDLFESWCGDDENTPLQLKIAKALREVVDHGVEVFFQHGNRDFVLGKRYAMLSRMQLLPEIVYQDIAGWRVLLTHGDLLCTDDIHYLKMRRWLRQPQILSALKCLPLRWRQHLAAKIRHSSVERPYQPELYAVNELLVEQWLERYAATLLIHGHTHMPNIHYYDQHKQRVVLSDWDKAGELVYLSASGVVRQSWPLRY